MASLVDMEDFLSIVECVVVVAHNRSELVVVFGDALEHPIHCPCVDRTNDALVRESSSEPGVPLSGDPSYW
jgi:hypothetical protein